MTYTQGALLLALGIFAGGTSGFAKDYKLSKCDSETRLGNRGIIAGSVDGDTVHLQVDNKTYSVRLLGLDAPESHFMGKSQGEWAEKATTALNQLLPVGAGVTIEYGTTACDNHGRLLVHLFKGKVHANSEMVKLGFAVNYCVAPDFRYCDTLSRFTGDAIQRQIGMYSAKNFELPYDFRRRIGNQPQRSFVGNLSTKEVRRPGHQNDVPIAERVFFYSSDTVQAPYHIVE